MVLFLCQLLRACAREAVADYHVPCSGGASLGFTSTCSAARSVVVDPRIAATSAAVGAHLGVPPSNRQTVVGDSVIHVLHLRRIVVVSARRAWCYLADRGSARVEWQRPRLTDLDVQPCLVIETLRAKIRLTLHARAYTRA